MQTIAIVLLILGLAATIIVLAALILSSQISREEGLPEHYDEWETSEPTQDVQPKKSEQ